MCAQRIIPGKIPEEMENPENPENPDDLKIGTIKSIYNSLSEDKPEDKENFKPAMNFAIEYECGRPTVFLSWKKNFKAVTNWMRKHMATYPETQEGFLVKFIDDKRNRWYKVERCNGNEWGETIDGESYKILPFRFDINREEKNENKNNLKK